MSDPYIWYDDESGYSFKATASREPAEGGMRPLYTQQSLYAAILKAHDAAIGKAERIIESRKIGFADDDAELQEMLNELQALKGQP